MALARISSHTHLLVGDIEAFRLCKMRLSRSAKFPPQPVADLIRT